jgi:hypothetical protein
MQRLERWLHPLESVIINEVHVIRLRAVQLSHSLFTLHSTLQNIALSKIGAHLYNVELWPW